MTTADLPDATEPEEVASAILDGEATPAELARADEPAVAAALASFRRVADAVAGSAPATDDLGRERAIAAALGAWGTEAGGGPPVDELAGRRRARRGLGLVGVAAAVLAALAIGGIALRGDDDRPTDTAASAPDAAGESDTGAGAGGAASGQAGGSAFATLHLGEFEDVEALTAAAVGAAAARETADDGFDPLDNAVEEGAAAGSDAATESAGAPTPAAGGATAAACLPPPPPPGAPVTTSTATLGGRPVLVLVVGSGDAVVVQVSDALTCELRYEGPPG